MSTIKTKFLPKPDAVWLKFHPDTHQLSSEQQLFFLQITENVFGFNEQLRLRALNQLSDDCNVAPLLPYLSRFIYDTIETNIAYPDLSILIYTVRMVKSLLLNKWIELKLHLHLIVPAVVSCVVSKRICKNPHDNHWILRDYSAKILAILCRNFNNSTNNLKCRIINLYVATITNWSKPLTSLYGSVKGLICFGEDTVKVYLVPQLNVISLRLYEIVKRYKNIITFEIQQIINVIVRNVAPILLKLYGRTDEQFYVTQYNYLGYFLYDFIKI